MSLYIVLLVAGIIIDQLVKWWTVAQVMLGQNISIIPNVLAIDHVNNYGAAYNILNNKRWLFYIITIIAVIIFSYLLLKGKERRPLFLTSITLLLAGTIGNAIDRVFRGHVVDMIAINLFNLPFLNFVCNIADILITSGVILLIVYLLKDEQKK
ncbi:signal peptidase II [Bombilactobacillus thymidiniphilus]|uniref:Lipoprotein signal peptidase n=1 Tax=Bombilactobacillus thymidiniphilus TaxID=2923363 RepID=A0ABY4PD85_9LACO|nr:signal peptidase II [Bombilactobacillus thymidiniphilus]UQS83575.1 signal peptidase II [Bombilactobacillus thymidiniphilus]